MMALRLGKFADVVHEVQRLAKIAESEASLDAMGIVKKFPLRSLGVEQFRFLSCQWRDTAPAGGAGFLDKSFRHGPAHFLRDNVRAMLACAPERSAFAGPRQKCFE